jgi:hypothetical protein
MNVGERQRRLSEMVEQDLGIVSHDLYGYLWNRYWLRLAHDDAAQNAGRITAGCNGITMQDFDTHLENNLECLREDLQAGTFTPHPVRRVYIPKASGRMRPLGMPMCPVYCPSCPWLWECPWPISTTGAGGYTSSFWRRLVDLFGERRGLRCRRGWRPTVMIAGVRVLHRGLCGVLGRSATRPVRHPSAIVRTSTWSSWAAVWAA